MINIEAILLVICQSGFSDHFLPGKGGPIINLSEQNF